MMPPDSTGAGRKVLAAFRKTPLCGQLLSLAASRNLPLFLTGGFVRDVLLDRGEPRDLDLTVPVDPAEYSLEWSRLAGGSLVPLDQERGTYRVALKFEGRLWYWDFTSFRGNDLAADLRLRDFTANALAFCLQPPGTSIIDPTGGIPDLSARIIRQTGPTAFEDDPLRKLRALRLATQLGFALHPETAARLPGEDLLSAMVSGERVREELGLLLSASRSFPSVSLLVEGGILATLWAPGGPDLGLFRRLEEAVEASAGGDLGHFLSLSGTHDLPFGALLKLLCLQFAAVPQPTGAGDRMQRHINEVGRILALGRTAMKFLTGSLDSLLTLESDPDLLSTAQGPWGYFDRFREAGLGGLILSSARSAAPSSRAEEMATFYRHRYLPDLDAPKLLAAEEVAALSGLPPGPELGDLIRRLAMARRLGLVSSTEDARAWLKEIRGRQAPFI